MPQSISGPLAGPLAAALANWRQLSASARRAAVREARAIGAEFGVRVLLTRAESNPKLHKSDRASRTYASILLHLAPAKLSGYQVCAHASPQCVKACLHTAGNPVWQNDKTTARIARTRFFMLRRDAFMVMLYHEIELAQQRAVVIGRRLAVRLNGTSDIAWHRVAPDLFKVFRTVRFYDYTKDVRRLSETLPRNYDLSFSRSEVNHVDALAALRHGARVAVVFALTPSQGMVDTWEGFRVVDADTHDLTFTRPRGVVLGLRAKGRARGKARGFVVTV